MLSPPPLLPTLPSLPTLPQAPQRLGLPPRPPQQNNQMYMAVTGAMNPNTVPYPSTMSGIAMFVGSGCDVIGLHERPRLQ